MRKKSSADYSVSKEKHEPCACSLCGQLYHNFAFKGGYICEDCLDSIKEQDAPPQAQQKTLNYEGYKTT